MASISLTLELSGEEFTDLVTALHAQGYIFQRSADSALLDVEERALFTRRAESLTAVLEQLFTNQVPSGPVGTCRHSIT